MKPNFAFYRLITFILLPIAGYIALNLLFILPSALANPSLLLPVFIYFAVAMYTFASFIFFVKGVQAGKPMKASLKDWIKVNAYVSIIFALFAILATLTYLGSPQLQKIVADNFDKFKTAMGQQSIDESKFLLFLKRSLIFLAVYSAVLVTHIIITLRIIKKYAGLFARK
ncbi:MAG TPA: hypothetical protein VHB48_04705 [Chitinophagaceae bacterium]|nr:hypothetical protein [Chitinophagaceae bacterium]